MKGSAVVFVSVLGKWLNEYSPALKFQATRHFFMLYWENGKQGQQFVVMYIYGHAMYKAILTSLKVNIGYNFYSSKTILQE